MEEINYFSKEVLDNEAKILWSLQESKNEGRGVSCVRTICSYLTQGKFETALLVRQLEGDKTRQYEDIESELRRFFGCRVHGKHGCKNYVCLTKTSYPKERRASK
jgi:hypothetical protein